MKMKLILENEEHEQVVVVTNTLEYDQAVAPDDTHFSLQQKPTNVPGERWDDERGVSWWRV